MVVQGAFTRAVTTQNGRTGPAAELHFFYEFNFRNVRTADNCNSPISPVVGDGRTIALSQIAPQQPADHRAPGAKNHKEDSTHDPAREVRIEEDTDAGIHQNRQHNS
jgi:hypothetical protein